MATVISRITIIWAKPCAETLDFRLCLKDSPFHEDDMSPDITEQINPHDHEHDVRKRRGDKLSIRKNETRNVEESGNNFTTTLREDIEDELLREDHITQHLSDSMINTDSEITSLMESEVEEGREFLSNRDDSSVSSLTEHEEALLDEGFPYTEDLLDNNDIPE